MFLLFIAVVVVKWHKWYSSDSWGCRVVVLVEVVAVRVVFPLMILLVVWGMVVIILAVVPVVAAACFFFNFN